MSKSKLIVIVIVAVVVAVQLVPVSRENPAATAPMDLSPEIGKIVGRSCFDCHSNETSWPWYSRVAPMSWLISHHVEEGREHLNFSAWGDLTEAKQKDALEEIWEEVEEGEMPLPSYLRLHGDAKLSSEDIQALKDWLSGLGVDIEQTDDDDED